MYRNQDATSDSDSGSSEGETSWKRAPRNKTEEKPSSAEPKTVAPQTGARRRNPIWGDVAQEEALAGNMTLGFGVQALPRDCFDDRGVESYDYTRARFDPRPLVEPVETEVPEKLLQLRAERAKEVRSRLGVPESIEKVDKDTASTAAVAKEICRRLKEPKSGLITCAVKEVGAQKALELLYASETIEGNGGLMINNGTRRRTPGGVFLHLLRNDKRIDKAAIDRIFEPDAKLRKIELSKRKRSAVEKKASKVIRALEQQLFGDEARSQTSDDEDDVPMKKATPTETSGARTSDLEDGEIED